MLKSPKTKAAFITIVLFAGLLYALVGDTESIKSYISDTWTGLITKNEVVENKSKSKPLKGNNYKGRVIDTYKGVDIYYNGSVRNVYGRHVTKDGYNLGLKYQCVEFVKRFYYEYFNHKMPDSYGHAKDFFNPNVKDVGYNKGRDLVQYRNGSVGKPEENDLIVFGPTSFNSFGHVAIVSKVGNQSIEIVQQNAGKGNPTRERVPLSFRNGRWYVDGMNTLGWLRK